MAGALASIKNKASAGVNRAASAVGIQRTNTEDSNAMDELAESCPKLTYQQRMIGFCSCFVLGYFITFMSFNYFIELIEGNPVPFVIIYSKFCLALIQLHAASRSPTSNPRYNYLLSTSRQRLETLFPSSVSLILNIDPKEM